MGYAMGGFRVLLLRVTAIKKHQKKTVRTVTAAYKPAMACGTHASRMLMLLKKSLVTGNRCCFRTMPVIGHLA